MRKIILLALVILITNVSLGQINITDLERVDDLWTKKGERKPYSGDFIQKYDNGQTKGIGTFKKGQLSGIRIQYYVNGNKMSEKEYKNAYPNGSAKEFFENGIIKQQGNLKIIKKTERGYFIIQMVIKRLF